MAPSAKFGTKRNYLSKIQKEQARLRTLVPRPGQNVLLLLPTWTVYLAVYSQIEDISMQAVP